MDIIPETRRTPEAPPTPENVALVTEAFHRFIYDSWEQSPARRRVIEGILADCRTGDANPADDRTETGGAA